MAPCKACSLAYTDVATVTSLVDHPIKIDFNHAVVLLKLANMEGGMEVHVQMPSFICRLPFLVLPLSPASTLFLVPLFMLLSLMAAVTRDGLLVDESSVMQATMKS